MSVVVKQKSEPTSNQNPLSEREMDVAQLLVTGASNTEIARDLSISPHTVKVHLRNVFEKLQVNSRTEASMLLLQRGWLTLPGVDGVGEEVEAAPPDPEPLSHLAAQPRPWQRLYLVGVMLLCLFALFVPDLRSRSQPGADLLSDSNGILLGKPTLHVPPRWEIRTPLMRPRSRAATAQLEGKIYVIGGEGSGGQTLSTVEVYDLSVNEWQPFSPLPNPVANAAAAPLGGQLYLAGGSQNSSDDSDLVAIRDSVWSYTPADESWQERGNLPGPLAGAAMTSDVNALYLVGGYDGRNMHDEIWRLEPLKDAENPLPNWELVSRLDVPRAFLGAVVVGKELFVVGGYDGRRELNNAHIYNLETGEWRTLPPLSTPRGGLSLVHDGLSSVFAVGGGWTQPIATQERFDAANNLWSNFPSPIQGEWRHVGAIGNNGHIHLIGGRSGDYLDVHLRYQSSFQSLLLPLIKND